MRKLCTQGGDNLEHSSKDKQLEKLQTQKIYKDPSLDLLVFV